MLSLSDSPPWPPCPAPFNMAAHVLQHSEQFADNVALRLVAPEPDEELPCLTYAALKAAVLGTASGLLQIGLQPGDIVLMRLGNTPDFPIAYLGAIAAGLVPVPTSAALTETEVSGIVTELSPRLILHDPDVPTSCGAPELGLSTLRALRNCDPADWHMGDPDRLGYIIYTSGTSGKPRGVAHAHRAIWARQMMHKGWYDLRPDDVMMHAGAFNWTYTLGTGLMDPWSVGATALIPAPGTPASALPQIIAREEATIFAAAPGVYRQMLAHGEMPSAPALRHGLSAGEKMPVATHEAWNVATGKPIFEAYGMSECSTFISSSPDRPSDPDKLGRSQPGRRVAILGPDGPVPRGDAGVIAIHHDDPGLMRGYYGHPDETEAKFRGDWFLTGDIGTMDPDGQISYLGRNDDMMNAGGYRVSPVEVEAALMHAPGVTGIGAAQVEVKPGTFIIVAFYTAASALDEAELRDYVEPKLAQYKRPRAYVHIPSLPTGANGKLLRRRLPAFWPAA